MRRDVDLVGRNADVPNERRVRIWKVLGLRLSSTAGVASAVICNISFSILRSLARSDALSPRDLMHSLKRSGMIEGTEGMQSHLA